MTFLEISPESHSRRPPRPSTRPGRLIAACTVGGEHGPGERRAHRSVRVMEAGPKAAVKSDDLCICMSIPFISFHFHGLEIKAPPHILWPRENGF